MLNLFQNDSESGMIPFPEYFIRNLYVHRFRLSSRSADTRRRIVRWLFLHFHVYDYHPADAETTGRYLSRERFPPLLFMTLTEDFRKDSSLCLRIISTDFYTLYLEGNVYCDGRCFSGGGQLTAQLRAELCQYVGRAYHADAAVGAPLGAAGSVDRHVHRAVLPRFAVFILPVAQTVAAAGAGVKEKSRVTVQFISESWGSFFIPAPTGR